MANRFDTNKLTKSVKFMGMEVDIRKLSVGQVLAVQEKAKDLAAKEKEKQAKLLANPEADVEDDSEANIDMLLFVLKSGVGEMSEFTKEEFLALPMDELSTLSAEVMKYSGLSAK